MGNKLSPLEQELLNRADAIFTYVGEAAEKAANFAGQQIPDIAIQYIAYNRVYLSLVVGIACFILFLQQFLVLKYCRARDKYYKDEGGYNDDGHWFAYFLSTLIIGLGSVTAILANMKELIMVWVAPKIFLIEHIVHLVKG